MYSIKSFILIIIMYTLFSCHQKKDSNIEKKNVKIKSTEFIYGPIQLADIKKIEDKNNSFNILNLIESVYQKTISLVLNIMISINP